MGHLSVRRRRVALGLVAAALGPGSVRAQAWPSRPVTLVVGSAAGGGTDEYARAVAPMLGARLKQTVIVENVAGASGALAAQRVLRAPADGHTLLFANSDLVLAPLVHKGAGYGPKDLTPLGLFGYSPLVLVAHPSLPATNVDQLVSLAKAKPDSVTVGLAGVASLTAVATRMLVKTTGIDIVAVPYKGAAPALTDLLAGQINTVVTALANALPHVQGGKLKALGMLSPTRSPLLPNVPTLSESTSAKGVSMDIWVGLVGPAGLPADITATINSHVQEILADPAFRSARQARGDTTAAPAAATEFARFLAAEEARFRAIVPGMKLE